MTSYSWFLNISSYSDRDSICAEMNSLASYKWLIIVLLIQTAFSMAALPLLIWFSRKVFRMVLVHHNTKCVLILHLTALIAHIIARIVYHMIDLITFLNYNDPCDIIPTAFRCVITRSIFAFPLILMEYSPFFLSLERCFATMLHMTYGRNRIVGPILVVVQLTVVTCDRSILYYQSSFDIIVYYCVSAILNPQTIYTLLILMVLQIICLVLFILLEIKNKQLKANINMPFIARYEVSQILRSLNGMKPLVYSLAIIQFLFISIQFTIIKYGENWNRNINTTLFEGINLVPEYAFLLPILVTYYEWKERKVRTKQLEKEIDENLNGKEVHFSRLDKLWR